VDSIFPALSIAKPITATAVMMLVEEGLLGLNRPVVDYIPEICGKGTDKILIFHLLTHTSGYDELVTSDFIDNHFDSDMDVSNIDVTEHPKIHQLMHTSYPVNPVGPPGATMRYCNYNFILLAEVVRRVSRQSFTGFIEKRIFKPLGMRNSSFLLEDVFRGRMVKRGPDLPFPEFDDEDWLDWPTGSGGLKTTAGDIAIFSQMFLNGGLYNDVRLLSRPSISEMTRNQIEGIEGEGPYDTKVAEASYGLGFFIPGKVRWPFLGTSLSPPHRFTHSGTGGVRFWVDTDQEIVGVFFGVAKRLHPDLDYPTIEADLFQDMVTAAISD
jgi:CubicO group peptidase (beta-lactamase class C family)